MASTCNLRHQCLPIWRSAYPIYSGPPDVGYLPIGVFLDFICWYLHCFSQAAALQRVIVGGMATVSIPLH
eukprot:6050802-Amphidinium_carterae.1